MANVTEIDALKAVDDALGGLGEDKAAVQRVLDWAWGKYSSRPAPAAAAESATQQRQPSDGSRHSSHREAPKAPGGGKATQGRAKKAKQTASILKDLNLKPQGKKSFLDFVNEKKPSTNWEKCTVAVYYVRKYLDAKVGASHVLTCFKDANWRQPSDLRNTLQVAASKEGWLDTKDMDDIKVTPRGDNLVEHDLPSTPTPKK